MGCCLIGTVLRETASAERTIRLPHYTALGHTQSYPQRFNVGRYLTVKVGVSMRFNKPPDCFLSFAEVAEIIGLSETIIRHCECGTDELTRIKLGSRTVFSFNDVQNWIERRVRQARERQSNLALEKAESIKRRASNKAINLRLIK